MSAIGTIVTIGGIGVIGLILYYLYMPAKTRTYYQPPSPVVTVPEEPTPSQPVPEPTIEEKTTGKIISSKMYYVPSLNLIRVDTTIQNTSTSQKNLYIGFSGKLKPITYGEYVHEEEHKWEDAPPKSSTLNPNTTITLSTWFSPQYIGLNGIYECTVALWDRYPMMGAIELDRNWGNVTVP